MPSHRLMRALEADADRFDFFEAMRRIECSYAHKPRLGEGVKASDDPVRLSQEPELVFPPGSISHFLKADDSVAHPRLVVNFMGLFGPHGPMPLHLTEYVRERMRHHHDSAFARFADIFHHRMISLFYRAWANARPALSYDRPTEDRFGFYVGSLFGIGGKSFRERDALTDRAKLFYAGHFAGQSKHPEGLRAIISHILQIPVHIEEFVGEWMSIHESDQTRLGWAVEVARLGQSALLGSHVWGCQHKFRVKLGPMKLWQYVALLPGGAGLAQLLSTVRQYMGDELVWDAQLLLETAEVPEELALGKPNESNHLSMNGEAQLGWSMWLGPRRSQRDADDLLLNPFIKLGTV